MRYLIAASLMVTPVTAHASITIPYFRSLSEQAVCGRQPRNCQPSSSRRWVSISGIDYHGRPSDFLGRSYDRSAFERSVCIRAPIAESDVQRSGRNTFTGTFRDDATNQFRPHAVANLSELLRGLIGSLPAELQADAGAALNNSVTENLSSTIQLEYERIDLTTDFMDRNMSECLASVPRSARVITGVSVIKVSGTWTQSRVSSLISHVEASIGFRQLSAGIRSEWDRQKGLLLQGTFQPMSYVFRAAVREGTGRNR